MSARPTSGGPGKDIDHVTALVTEVSPDRDAAAGGSVRRVRTTAGMDTTRSGSARRDMRQQRESMTMTSMAVHESRAELVRYFAWGYLSRRELNDRLKHAAPAEHLPSARPSPRAA